MTSVDFTDLHARKGDGSHLTKEQVSYIESYMREVLVRLELNYWHVYVAKDMAPEHCLLMIEPTDGRRVAMLYVSETWWTESPDHRLDIVHEALHLTHHDQEEVIRRFKNDTGDVSPYALSIIWSQFKMETERMVDGLSYVIAPTMPEWSPPSSNGEVPHEVKSDDPGLWDDHPVTCGPSLVPETTRSDNPGIASLAFKGVAGLGDTARLSAPRERS